MPNRGTTRPVWQTILVIGAAQFAVGVVMMLIGAVAQSAFWLTGGGDVVIVGAVTAIVGVVLSWVRARA